MTRVVPILRAVLAALPALALSSACGGNAFSRHGGDGGQSSGGDQSRAGADSASKANAGAAIGGSSAAGGSGSGASGGGPTGAGGDIAESPSREACTAPVELGNCQVDYQRWYHDPSTGLCKPFVYTGCGGNANNYETFEACQKACPGGAPNYDACEQPTDCVIGGPSCCGICDRPGITARDLAAYHREHHQELQTCQTDIECVPCPVLSAGTGSLHYFVPDCVAGQCTVVDLRASPLTACAEPADCRLRAGAGCCETCGAEGDWIAVRNDGSLEELVCGDELIGCPGCVAVPPPGVLASCENGRCVVLIALGASDG